MYAQLPGIKPTDVPDWCLLQEHTHRVIHTLTCGYQGCDESIMWEKVRDNLKCQKRCAFQCIKSLKMGFCEGQENLKSDKNDTLTSLESHLWSLIFFSVPHNADFICSLYPRSRDANLLWKKKVFLRMKKKSIFHFVSIEVYTKWSLKEKKKFWRRHFAQNHKYLQLDKSTKYCKKGTALIALIKPLSLSLSSLTCFTTRFSKK